ncbi:hypothetical protein M3Y98_00249300 [Aphelenchoides besseyi]|nr:hypothetical protein M3Y98_00249300 [Aphelenchoides besseyi]
MRILAIFTLLCLQLGAIQIPFDYVNNYLYRMNITVGKQNLTVLFDLTSTQLWLFGSRNSSAKFDTSLLALGNQTNLTVLSRPNTINYTRGIYDSAFNISAYNAGNTTLTLGNNKTINAVRFNVVFADNYTALRSADRVLGAGIIGIGMSALSNETNYLTMLMNGSSRFVLCTRPPYKQAMLSINETYFNRTVLANATVTKLSLISKIKPGAFEFNITGIRIGYGYVKIATQPAIISTLNNYISVDRDTWNYIRMNFRPALDRRTSNYFVDCLRMRQLRVFFNVKTVNNTNSVLMIPGSDLVVPTSSGYCALKIRPFNGTGLVFGGPFLRHHCVQVTYIHSTLRWDIQVALDLTSPNFWVFGEQNLSDQKLFSASVFDLKRTTQLYVAPNPVAYQQYRRKGMSEFDFNLTLYDARTTVEIGDSSLGIPTVGVNSNLSQLTQYMTGSSGMFGITRNAYANSIPMRADGNSALTLYMPRFPKTVGRLTSGNRSIDKCDTKFTTYDLVGSANDSARFAFYSTIQNQRMIISTTTSYLSVDSKTFAYIEEQIQRVVYDRKHKPIAHRPNRRHKLIPCAAVKLAPNITIGSQANVLTLLGKHYIRKTHSGYCILKVRQTTGDWILGAPLLQRFCLRIDFANQKIAFSLAKDSD